MTFAARLIAHEPAPIELDALLEQLQLTAAEVFGPCAVVELLSPLRPNGGWRARLREYGLAFAHAGGSTPTAAAVALARELLAKRTSGVEAEALRELIEVRS